MKKVMTLALVLCLALSVVSSAFAAQSLTAVSGAFTYEVPDDYIRMDPDTILELLTDEEALDAFAEIAGGENARASAEALFSSFDFSGMEIVYTPDMSGNLNIQLVDGGGITPSLIPQLVENFDELLINQYLQLGFIGSADAAHPLGAIQAGDNIFYGLGLEVGDLPVYLLITFSEEGSTQATLTFTNMPEDDIVPILESFKLLIK